MITTITHSTQTKVNFKNTLDIHLIFEINTIETMVIFHNKTAAKER